MGWGVSQLLVFNAQPAGMVISRRGVGRRQKRMEGMDRGTDRERESWRRGEGRKGGGEREEERDRERESEKK